VKIVVSDRMRMVVSDVRANVVYKILIRRHSEWVVDVWKKKKEEIEERKVRRYFTFGQRQVVVS
jgi:hypothetical protein